ncbi:MAG: 2-hydroxyacid dehydrogenase [Silicimonas sp.]|nr:2-hydroxyacid dehydrogenase [Silicimonas sp.]
MPERPELLQIGGVSDRMAERLAASFTVTRLPDAYEGFLAERGADFVAIATTHGVPDDVQAGLPNLKVISSFGVGYDSINADAAAEHGVIVAHTPDVLNDEVADTAIMLWLAVSKELVPAERWARSGTWEAQGNYPLARSVRGRTVGILGLGRIGQTIAKMAGMFDAKVIYHARTKKDVPYRYCPDLVEMAREADVLIVITPGGPETRHLVNAEVLRALGPEGILINIARGSVVDEAALVEALGDGTLGAAGLDVFEEEPKIPEALKSMDNVVLVPHIGSATKETRAAMGDLVCDNLDRWLVDGRVIAPVPECRHLNE